MSAFRAVNEVLVGLFRDILGMEEETIITEEYKDITCTDMHIIEAIGIDEPKNMSTVANDLGITVSTLTTGVNSLVRKAYVEKIKGEVDRRVVFLKLTDKGIKAYRHHEQFHIDMTNAVIKQLDDDEIVVLVKALKGVSEYFELEK